MLKGRIETEDEIEVLVVEPGKHPYVETIENTLRAFQQAVGGYIEVVSLNDGNVIILNEEGKLIGLEGNRALGGDILTGSFLITGTAGENFASLPQESIEFYKEQFWEVEQYTQEEIAETIRCEFFPFDL